MHLASLTLVEPNEECPPPEKIVLPTSRVYFDSFDKEKGGVETPDFQVRFMP